MYPKKYLDFGFTKTFPMKNVTQPARHSIYSNSFTNNSADCMSGMDEIKGNSFENSSG